MKKSLSLVLAAVLAFGSAVSAFAAANIVVANARPINPANISGNAAIYKWDGDNGKFVVTTNTAITYGSTVGFMISDLPAVVNPATDIAKNSDDVKNLKAYVTYQIPNSSTLVEKVAIEYKKVENTVIQAAPFYAYFATIKTKTNTTAANADLYGEMRVGTSKGNAEDAARSHAPFTLTLSNANNGGSTGTTYTAPVTDFGNWAVSFTNASDIDVVFGDQASYIVDATGQSKLNLGYSLKFNSEFAAKYPAANLEFLTFTAKPSFNRIGELTIYSEEGKYLYELTADGFKEPKYTYDEDYEAFVLKTRTLAAYVISDIELEPEVIEETPAPSVPGQNPPTGGTSDAPSNGGKPNPNTGR